MLQQAKANVQMLCTQEFLFLFEQKSEQPLLSVAYARLAKARDAKGAEVPFI